MERGPNGKGTELNWDRMKMGPNGNGTEIMYTRPYMWQYNWDRI
jgi:hypothetical protein